MIAIVAAHQDLLGTINKAWTKNARLEIRLLDPNCYTVPGGVETVSLDQAAATAARLFADLAQDNADQQGTTTQGYRVQVTRVRSAARRTARRAA